MTKEKLITYLNCFLRYAFGALFIVAGVAKLSGTALEVQAFQTIGLGMWFLYFVGIWELVAGVLMFITSKKYFGALLIVCVCFGAFLAQVFVLHQDWIHTVVLGSLAVHLTYQNRKKNV